jgi:hypothetical protein
VPDLRRYSVDDSATDWTAAEKQVAEGRGVKGKSMIVSVKSNDAKRKAEADPPPSPKKKKKISRHKS